MRGRSYSYSPSPPRHYARRGCSPSPRGRYGGRGQDLPTSHLVRNLRQDCREPRGFGFIQYVDPADAAEAKYQMDRQILFGRELTVVFAEENRKRPSEMRAREGRGHAYVAPVLPHRRTRTLHAVVSYVLEVEAMNHAHLLQKGGTTPGDLFVNSYGCTLLLDEGGLFPQKFTSLSVRDLIEALWQAADREVGVPKITRASPRGEKDRFLLASKAYSVYHF